MTLCQRQHCRSNARVITRAEDEILEMTVSVAFTKCYQRQLMKYQGLIS